MSWKVTFEVFRSLIAPRAAGNSACVCMSKCPCVSTICQSVVLQGQSGDLVAYLASRWDLNSLGHREHKNLPFGRPDCPGADVIGDAARLCRGKDVKPVVEPGSCRLFVRTSIASGDVDDIGV